MIQFITGFNSPFNDFFGYIFNPFCLGRLCGIIVLVFILLIISIIILSLFDDYDPYDYML